MDEKNKYESPRSIRWSGIPVRYNFVWWSLVAFVEIYAMRVNLSIGLVAMVKNLQRRPNEHDDFSSLTACRELMPHSLNTSSSAQQIDSGEFEWDTSEQALILGSFFYGYVLTQLPGGILAERWSAKWLFGGGVLVTSIFTILTPFAARWGLVPLIITRVIEGFAEGVTFPAMNSLIGRWAPKMERSRMSTLIFMGSPIGTVLAMALSGVLADSAFLGGWPSIFYVFGFSGCVWFVFWAYAIYDDPQSHPRISAAELQYIQENQSPRRTTERRNPPWKKIFLSVPVYALAVTHFGQNWGFYTLLTEMPTYLSNILHFEIKQNGLLSSLPYVIQTICAIVASLIADSLRQSGRLSITAIRKIINSIAFFGPALCMVAVALVGCHPILIVALLCAAMGLNGFMYSGFNVTHVDMSPEFAGTLMGITNTVSNFSGFLAPFVVGRLTSEGQTLHNWGMIFICTSAVYCFTGLIYNVFCSAEPQPWGTSAQSTQPTTEKSNAQIDIKKKPPEAIAVQMPTK